MIEMTEAELLFTHAVALICGFAIGKGWLK